MKNLEMLSTQNPTEYWKLLDELKDRESSAPDPNISLTEWELYFKALNTSKTKEGIMVNSR